MTINLNEFETLLRSGKTYQEIATHYQMTKQNVALIKKKHFPKMSKKEYGAGLRALKKLEAFTPKNIKHDSDISRAKSLFFTRKRQNAKSKKWGFDVQYTDIIWNDVCPILGIPINWENDVRGEDSPSMDRIDSTKGYIPGNVQIVSWRANRIKNDGTEEEHRKIADFLRKVLTNQKDGV